MPRMLIVDGDTEMRRYIRQYAEYEGYFVSEAADGERAVTLCQKSAYDLIILELVLPQMSGLDVLREIRSIGQTPVIVCSTRAEEPDRLRSFSLGADDFVAKPFSPRELMMRAAAIRKRTESPMAPSKASRYAVDDLTVDFTARKVTIGDECLELSPKEYDLLFFLVRNRNIALARGTLICEVWGYDFPGDERTLDTHIKLLRRKLREYARLIVTVRGVGYRFEG